MDAREGIAMAARTASRIIQDSPEESREAAQLVIDQHGEPDEEVKSAAQEVESRAGAAEDVGAEA